MKLRMPHIHGINLFRPVLQQTIRKSPGGRARVKTNAVRHIKPEIFYRRQKLIASAADKALSAQKHENRIGRIILPRLQNRLRLHPFRQFPLRIDDNLSRHDEAFCLLPAFRQTLLKNKLIGAHFFCHFLLHQKAERFKHGFVFFRANALRGQHITGNEGVRTAFETTPALIRQQFPAACKPQIRFGQNKTVQGEGKNNLIIA